MPREQKTISNLTVLIILVLIVAATFGLPWLIGNDYSVFAPTSKLTKPKRIVAVGDLVCDPKDPHASGKDPAFCQDKQVADQIKKLNPDAILMLGDLQYSDGSLAKFQNSFNANWGDLKKIIYPAPGNHEYGTPGAAGYLQYFKDAPVDVSQGYYSIRLAGWKIISLDSNCERNSCDPNSTQLKWLDDRLGSQKTRCTLAFWHHPHFTSGQYSTDAVSKARSTNFWARLEANQTDVVLNGHDHIYERFSRQTANGQPSDKGIRQFTVGTGGVSHYTSKSPAANSEKLITDQFGVLVLDLNSNAYKWQFVTSDGRTLDSGIQTCH